MNAEAKSVGSTRGFVFRSVNGDEVTPPEWLREWAEKYPVDDYAEYDELIAKHLSFNATAFERMGKWKDGARTDAQWRENVASIAYPIWMQAASELPRCPEESRVTAFLNDWSNRKYTDTYKNRRVEKKFGLSRATTLLHFVCGGRYPIFDSRVRRAMNRLLDLPIPNTVQWYLESFLRLSSEVAVLCKTENLRRVDMALFSYGARKLSFEKKQPR